VLGGKIDRALNVTTKFTEHTKVDPSELIFAAFALFAVNIQV